MTIALVIARQGFRDEEYFEVKKVLESAGVKTSTASWERGVCRGSQGGKAEADLSIDEISAGEFDGVVFVGGQGMIRETNNPELIELALDFSRANKIVSAICIAPEILGHAGLLKGKKATSTSMAEDTLRNAGANFIGEAVVQDGKIITAEGPAAAEEFGRLIAAELQQ